MYVWNVFAISGAVAEYDAIFTIAKSMSIRAYCSYSMQNGEQIVLQKIVFFIDNLVYGSASSHDLGSFL